MQKKQKQARKAEKMAKVGNVVMSRHIQHHRDKVPKQLAEVCRNKKNCVATKTKQSTR